MSHTYFEKGECDVCKTLYDKEAHQVDNDPRANEGRYTVECPKCGYHPRVITGIKRILEKDEESILIKKGVVLINSEKLSRDILEVIVKNWPVPKR